MAYTDIMTQLNTDLDVAYDESGEVWYFGADSPPVAENAFTGLSRSSRNDEMFDTRASESTMQERELRWRVSDRGSMKKDDVLYFDFGGSYWMTNEIPELIENEYVVNIRQVKYSTRGART